MELGLIASIMDEVGSRMRRLQKAYQRRLSAKTKDLPQAFDGLCLNPSHC